MSKCALVLTPTHSLRGGVESIVADLVREMPSRGWRVVAGLAKGDRFNDPARFAETQGIKDWVAIDGCGGTAESRVRAILRVAKEVRPCLLFSARVYDAWEASRRLKLLDGCLRFGLTIQAYEPDYFSDLRRWGSMADLCVTSGRLVRGACVEVCGMESDRCVSIPGGVRAGGSCRQAAAGELRVGYAGRLEEGQKRVWDIVKIATDLREAGLKFRLVVAGSGPEEKDLVAQLTALLGEGFEFLGWIGEPEKLREFYRGLDVFLHTAGHEGVTIAPREAMAEGVVPVISEFAGFWTEGHFRPGKNCLSFAPGDTSAAVRAIARLDADRGMLGALSRAAASSQCGIYSWDEALDAWAAAFDQCLELPAKPALRRSPVGDPDSGRLARMGLPPGLAQKLRDALGRRPVHTCGGDEWPHAGPPAEKDLAEKLEAYARESEARARG